MKLLIAEDDTDIARALRALLEHNNYTVDTVANGNDAYAYCLTGNYDGIVLDIMMPGMDGLEVLKALRADAINTPVLLLTAKSDIEDRVKGLDAGADDYLPKPFAATELLARIRAMLRRNKLWSDRSPAGQQGIPDAPAFNAVPRRRHFHGAVHGKDLGLGFGGGGQHRLGLHLKPPQKI